MKSITLLFVLTLSTSCGLQKEYKRSLSIDPQMKAYVSNFEKKRGGAKISDLKTAFAKMEDGIAGYCQNSERTEYKFMKQIITKTPEVYLNPKMWATLSIQQREVLVFHELGHCILNRPHKDGDEVINGAYIRSSVMSTYLFTGSQAINYASNYYDYYLSELFNRPRSYYASANFTAYSANYSNSLTVATNEYVEEIISANLTIDENQAYITKSDLRDGCVINKGKITVDSEGNEIQDESLE